MFNIGKTLMETPDAGPLRKILGATIEVGEAALAIFIALVVLRALGGA